MRTLPSRLSGRLKHIRRGNQSKNWDGGRCYWYGGTSLYIGSEGMAVFWQYSEFADMSNLEINVENYLCYSLQHGYDSKKDKISLGKSRSNCEL